MEQKIRYVDADGKDQHAFHLSGWEQDQLVAYLRVIPMPASGNLALYKIGRVLTRLTSRGQGRGMALMEELLRVMQGNYAPCLLTMSAQAYLQEFYRKFGFHTQGDLFYEEGIPHLTMQRSLQKN